MDGKVDGKLSSPGHWRVADERKRFAAARKLEDKLAGLPTTSASSGRVAGSTSSRSASSP
jgi:hypothetical protein